MKKNIRFTRIFSFVMAVMLLAGLHTAPVSASTVTMGEWEYTLSGNTASLHKYLGSSASVTLPTEVAIDGRTYLLTKLDAQAFMNNEDLQEITIPEDFKTIGQDAFCNCTHLKKATFLGNIGDYAPNSSNHIGLFLGAGANETSFEIIFGPKVTKIPAWISGFGYGSSEYCHVTSLTIGKNVTEIGKAAFHYCADLKTIHFPAGSALKTIGESAFRNCDKLQGTDDSGVLALPDSVTSIGTTAFSDCLDLKNVDLPTGLLSLGQESFSGCTYLESVKINSDLVTVGEKPFFNTGTNTRGGYTVSVSKGVTKIPEGLFYVNANYEGGLYAHIGELVFPSTLKTIGKYAFQNCYDLTDVNFEEAVSLETIEASAFYNNYALKVIDLPKITGTIASSAFGNCTALTKVSSSRLTGTVENNAFSGCPTALLFQSYYGSWLDTYAKNNGFQSGYYAPKKTKITSITNSASGVKLKWKKAVGAKEYHIYRKAEGETKWKDVGTATKRALTDKTAKNGVIYQYKVAGSVDDLIGKMSAAKKIGFLSRPKFSTVKNVKKRKVSLEWKKNKAATGYIIRYANNSAMKKAKTVKVTGATSRVIKKLRKGEKYYFQLQSYRKVGSTTYKSYWSKKKAVTIKK